MNKTHKKLSAMHTKLAGMMKTGTLSSYHGSKPKKKK